MRKKYLISAIIWFIVAFGWLVLCMMGIQSGMVISMIVLRGFLALLSLISGILNVMQYRKNK